MAGILTEVQISNFRR